MSGVTGGGAYVLLDLPDVSRITPHSSLIHQSESIRSIGDVIVTKSNSVASNMQSMAVRIVECVYNFEYLHYNERLSYNNTLEGILHGNPWTT